MKSTPRAQGAVQIRFTAKEAKRVVDALNSANDSLQTDILEHEQIEKEEPCALRPHMDLIDKLQYEIGRWLK